MTETRRPAAHGGDANASAARHGPLPPGQRRHRLVPPLRDPPRQTGASDPRRPGHRDRRGGDRGVRRARRRPGDVPRRQLDADFHCVSGWTAVGLRWEGVAFADFYRLRIEPALRPGAVVTHVEFRGLDGFRSVITIEDALDDDVLLADHLDGEPLGTDHGAPLRVVSPAQYGYISTKHLCSHRRAHRRADRRPPLVRARRTPALPPQGEGLGRRNATGRCPAAWSGRSTGPSRW